MWNIKSAIHGYFKMKFLNSIFKHKLTFSFYLVCILFSQNCRVDEKPNGSLLDQGTPAGFFITSALFEIIRKGPTRNWTSFSTPFTSTNPSDLLSLDRKNQTTYAFYVNSSNSTSIVYSSNDGTNFSKLGVTVNTANTNVFSVFNTRIQLSNNYSSDSGATWTSNATISGFCMVKDSDTSAYVLGNGFVNKTVDEGVNFTLVTGSPGFPSRSSGLCTYKNGKIFLLGGQSSDSNFFDLWESTDGNNWTQISSSVKPEGNSGFNRPCDYFSNSRIMGFAYSEETEYKYHVIGNNLALLQSKDGKSWQCTNPSFNAYYSGTNTISNRAVLLGKRLFIYGTSSYNSQNAYTDLE